MEIKNIKAQLIKLTLEKNTCYENVTFYSKYSIDSLKQRNKKKTSGNKNVSYKNVPLGN